MVAGLPGSPLTPLRAQLLTLALVLGPLVVSAQTSLVARADMGAVDPQSGFRLAWDAAVGWQVNEHSTLLLEVARENLSQETGGSSTFWETFLGGAWEQALGSQWMMRRQFFLTLRGGLLVRPDPLADAPYLGMGVGFRYPVSQWLRFQARVEEVLDAPRAQTLLACDDFGTCGPARVGGRVEHHLGLFAGVAVIR